MHILFYNSSIISEKKKLLHAQKKRIFIGEKIKFSISI